MGKVFLEWHGGYEPFEFDKLVFAENIEDSSYIGYEIIHGGGDIIIANGYAIVLKGDSIYLLVAMNGEYFDIYKLGRAEDVIQRIREASRND